MFYERVYATVLFIINDRHLAQDVTQETFIKAFAEKTNAKIGTVKSRLHRAKTNLATRLERLDIKKGDLG